MKRSLLVMALGGLLVAGPAAALAMQGAAAPAPLAQPGTETAATVPAGELALGSVRLTRKVMADGKPLAAGSYQVRLTGQEAAGRAPGATASYERFVEFVQGGQVKGREVASIVASADVDKVVKGRKPATGSSKVELLKGNEYLRVWINRGGNNYLIHLVVAAT
jgi:hypothetical protein